MAKKSLVVTAEAELRTKELELAVAARMTSAEDPGVTVQRAEAFFEFLMPGYTPRVDER